MIRTRMEWTISQGFGETIVLHHYDGDDAFFIQRPDGNICFDIDRLEELQDALDAIHERIIGNEEADANEEEGNDPDDDEEEPATDRQLRLLRELRDLQRFNLGMTDLLVKKQENLIDTDDHVR